MLTVLSHPLIDIKLTTLRDKDTPPHDFRRTLFEIAGLMSFDVFKFLNRTQISVTTPLETTDGYRLTEPAPAIISILRAGNGLADAFSALLPEAPIGHLGLQRNEDTHNPEAYYEKLPRNIDSRQIILADPMLATGGSAIMAVDRLKRHGVKDMVFACLVAAPEGVAAVEAAHPELSIITAGYDRALDENCYILPGLGDAGDRIYNTV
ncbi:MAG: uracil phosphoribosyltransferase [Candidatus Puniceispirillaceae bacterium]